MSIILSFIYKFMLQDLKKTNNLHIATPTLLFGLRFTVNFGKANMTTIESFTKVNKQNKL